MFTTTVAVSYTIPQLAELYAEMYLIDPLLFAIQGPTIVVVFEVMVLPFKLHVKPVTAGVAGTVTEVFTSLGFCELVAESTQLVPEFTSAPSKRVPQEPLPPNKVLDQSVELTLAPAGKT